jgi:hypothetical protein
MRTANPLDGKQTVDPLDQWDCVLEWNCRASTMACFYSTYLPTIYTIITITSIKMNSSECLLQRHDVCAYFHYKIYRGLSQSMCRLFATTDLSWILHIYNNSQWHDSSSVLCFELLDSCSDERPERVAEWGLDLAVAELCHQKELLMAATACLPGFDNLAPTGYAQGLLCTLVSSSAHPDMSFLLQMVVGSS